MRPLRLLLLWMSIRWYMRNANGPVARTKDELGGPDVMSLRQIVSGILEIIDRKRWLVPLPFALARLKAVVLQFAPSPLTLTRDQVTLLQSDNVVSDGARAAGLTLEGLGIAPDALQAVAPQYLWRFRPMGQFQRKNA